MNMISHGERVSFLAPLPPTKLRVNRRYGSWQGRNRLRDEYQEAVWIAGWREVVKSTRRVELPPGKNSDAHMTEALVNTMPWEKAHVALRWWHHRQGPDPDNALASLKPLIDVLTTKSQRPLGIIVDDSPEHVTVSISTEKVQSKADEGIVVTITRRH